MPDLRRLAHRAVGRVAPTITRGTAIANLAASQAAAARIVLSVAYLAAEERRGRAPRLLRFDLRRHGESFPVLVDSLYDLSVIEELYLWGEYETPLGDPTVVVDAGSNIGLAAIDFAIRCPGARVLAVEPDPRSLRKLRHNIRGFDAITVVPSALGAGPGSATFFSGRDSWVSGFKRSNNAQQEIEVDAITLDDLFERHSISAGDDIVLKLDVEGAETQVLDGFTRIGEVRLLLGEVHAGPGAPEADAFFERLDRAFTVEVSDRSAQTQTFVARRRQAG